MSMPEEAPFLFLTCKRESTPLLKDETAALFPEWRFSYSRPSFLTYRLPEGTNTLRSALERSGELIFASSCSAVLGKVSGAAPGEMPGLFASFMEKRFPEAWRRLRLSVPLPSRVHFWLPSSPAPTPQTHARASELSRFLPGQNTGSDLAEGFFPPSLPRPGEVCLDCAEVLPTEWYIGVHQVRDFHGRFPGGYFPLTIPTDGTSRAWMKFEEGLRWSGFPIGRGARCADIGASPGGGSQALLARGAEVLGVDPAEMAPAVLQNPDFTHLRGRISQLKKKLFRKTRWMIGDMNVAPNYTLDALEELTSSREIEVRGLLFTMKLFQTGLARRIPEYLDRVRGWGFNQIKVRQLTYNRQEVMVAALKHPFRSRKSK
ncbi:MAG: hypothetical protein IJG60_08795 [Thermoguttaceae bacterium]|nr:hypothetical protein [Thermoguttaceae bacterium]